MPIRTFAQNAGLVGESHQVVLTGRDLGKLVLVQRFMAFSTACWHMNTEYKYLRFSNMTSAAS